MSAYRQFVKEHIHEFDHLPKQTDRMRAVASLYRKQMGMPAKAKSTKPAKSTKSKGGIMTAGSVDKPELLEMGLQVHEKKQKGRPKKLKETKGGAMTGGAMTGGAMTGGGWFDDFSKGFMLPFQAVSHLAPVLSHLV
jgi:hypothetical protein